MPASRREAHAALTQSSPRRGRRGAVERGIARRPRIHQGPLAKKGGETRRAGGPLAQSSTLRPNRSPSPFASGSFLALDTKRAAQRAAPPFVLACDAKLEGLYVRGLETLGALGHFEFNRLAIVQCLEAISHNGGERSEEHTSELQSRLQLVCRLLLEKKHTCRPDGAAVTSPLLPLSRGASSASAHTNPAPRCRLRLAGKAVESGPCRRRCPAHGTVLR